MEKHVAIKCTYNDGDQGHYVGFNATCSVTNIKRNIDSGRVWCSDDDCQCKKFYKNGFTGHEPQDPCSESVLFREWKFGAGTYQNGPRRKIPMRLPSLREGGMAVLTTRFPGDGEMDRKIVGLFSIGDVTNRPEETTMVADERLRIRLPLEEARQLYFWDYYATKGRPLWGTGLVRYLTDGRVGRILADLRETVGDEKTRVLVDDILSRDLGYPKVTPPPARGPRASISGNRTQRVLVARKYGPGGEGAKHRELKEWVAANPVGIGLPSGCRAVVESPLESGDVPDVVFALPGNKFAVVEVETLSPNPGHFQALKYKVLKCAELRIGIGSQDVEAILVAWQIPDEVRQFCIQYGIRPVEKKL